MDWVNLDYGHSSIGISLPSGIRRNVLEAASVASVSLRSAFESAWMHPFGMTDPVSALTAGDRLVIVVNDHTRPTPTHDLLQLLWEKINGCVAADDITILVGTGTHRSPTEEELDVMLGAFRHAFHVQVHDCDHNLVDVGFSARGTRIALNRTVVEADQVITIGHIGVHYYAGYTGGRKGILPGVAGRETIEANHSQLSDPRSHACLYLGNPISEEMVEAARLVPIAFALDVVLTSTGDVATVVIGEPEAAHAAGREFWDEHFQVTFPKAYDVVIASAGGHPKDINLYQTYKAQYNAMRTVRDGGFLFLAAACPDGIGHPVFRDWIERSTTPEDLPGIYKEEGFVLGGHKALYHARDVQRASIYLHSEIDAATIRRFYMEPARGVASVLEAAQTKFGDNLRVLVIPHAADVFPVCSS